MKSFYPGHRLLVYVNDTLLGRESAEENKQRQTETIVCSIFAHFYDDRIQFLLKNKLPDNKNKRKQAAKASKNSKHEGFENILGSESAKSIMEYYLVRNYLEYDRVYDISEELYAINIRWNAAETSVAGKRELKDSVKRAVYHLMSEATGISLPWGALTGIRPVKNAVSILSSGGTEADVRAKMQGQYLVSEEKTDLSIQIARREIEILESIGISSNTSRINSKTSDESGETVTDRNTGHWSLYIGILFCPSICLYCSFSSHDIRSNLGVIPDYVRCLKKEIDAAAEIKQGEQLDTIYFGGGTPTSLSAAQLDDLFSYIEQKLDLSHLAEYTVEAGRPDSITMDKLKVMRDHGVTRISVNPQTMNQKTLDLIGRRHSVQEVVRAYEDARAAAFDNINMDVILGLPGETPDDMRHTFDEISRLRPDNLTVHSLALKTSARLNLNWDKYKDYTMTNSDEIMSGAYDYAESMGLKPYYLYRQKNMAGNLENTGFARYGMEGIYNILIIEEAEDIVGIGAGADCKQIGTSVRRCENVKDIDTYISRIDEMIMRKRKLYSKIIA